MLVTFRAITLLLVSGLVASPALAFRPGPPLPPPPPPLVNADLSSCELADLAGEDETLCAEVSKTSYVQGASMGVTLNWQPDMQDASISFMIERINMIVGNIDGVHKSYEVASPIYEIKDPVLALDSPGQAVFEWDGTVNTCVKLTGRINHMHMPICETFEFMPLPPGYYRISAWTSVADQGLSKPKAQPDIPPHAMLYNPPPIASTAAFTVTGTYDFTQFEKDIWYTMHEPSREIAEKTASVIWGKKPAEGFEKIEDITKDGDQYCMIYGWTLPLEGTTKACVPATEITKYGIVGRRLRMDYVTHENDIRWSKDVAAVDGAKVKAVAAIRKVYDGKVEDVDAASDLLVQTVGDGVYLVPQKAWSFQITATGPLDGGRFADAFAIYVPEDREPCIYNMKALIEGTWLERPEPYTCLPDYHLSRAGQKQKKS